MTLAKDWRCPKCGHEEHEPVRIRSISHPCYVNNDGTPRTISKDRDLVPVPDTAWAPPTGGAVQLTLEGAA